jgi:mutual gliding-motility protein MglA
MALINVKQKEIHCKIVYYGPGMSGKTSSLQYIQSRIPPEDRGELLSIATETERTLFFDCQLSEEPLLRGFRLRWHLYTLPGAVLYEHTKTAVLKGADGIVFVADSQPHRLDENRRSMHEMASALQAQDKTLRGLPIVLQYNKRDLPDILTAKALDLCLNPFQWQRFEAIAWSGWNTPTDARAGEGVMETFQAIRALVIDGLRASKEEINDPAVLRWGDVAKRVSQWPFSDMVMPYLLPRSRWLFIPKRTALQWLKLIIFTILLTLALFACVLVYGM